MNKKLQLTFEADGGSTSTGGLWLFPSNAVAIYDHHHTSISNGPSTVISSPIAATTLLSIDAIVDNERLPLPDLLLSSMLMPVGPTGNQRFLDRFYSYFDAFSQSTACIATGFGECSSTLLDKLWYLYSYIYKPTTTTVQYGISRFLISRHTSPFRLSTILNYASTSSSTTPLSTTSSILQSSTFLKSCYNPSLSITSSTLFVNFIKSTIFLHLAVVDNDQHDASPSDNVSSSSTLWLILRYYNDNDNNIIFFDRTGDNDFDLSSDTVFDGLSSVYNDHDIHSFGRISNNDNYYGDITGSNSIIVTLKTYNTIYLYHLQTLLFDLHDASSLSSSSSSTLWLNLRCFFVISFLSPVVDSGTHFLLVDQGKVGYLFHLQISIFCNLQDDNNVNGVNSVNDVTTSDVATVTTTIYESNTRYTVDYDNNLYFDTTLYLVLMQILLYDQLLYGTAHILRLQQLTLLSYGTTFNIVSAVVGTIFIKPYNNAYDFDLNITFATVFNNITFIASDDGATNGEASSAVTLQSYNPIYQFIISIDPATTVRRTYTVAGRAPSAITMTTQVYSSSPSPSTIIPGNSSPSSYDLSNNKPSSYQSSCDNNDNYYCDTTVSTSVIVSLKIYDTIYISNYDTTFDIDLGLYFDTVFDDRTGATDFDLYFNTELDAPSSVNNDSFSRTMRRLNLFYGRNDSTYYHTGTVLRPVYQQMFVVTIFITLLRSHIIDHGSVLYLTQQILLYNQQYVYDDCNNDSVSSVTVTSAVPESSIVIDTESSTVSVANNKASSAGNGSPATVTLRTYDTVYNLYFDTAFDTALDTTFTSASHASPSYDIDSSSSAIYDGDSSTGNDSPAAVMIMITAVKMMTNDMNSTVYFAVIDAVSSADITESSAIIMMTTAFHESPSAIHNDTVYFATIADEAQYDYSYGDTAVSIASPSIVIDPESSSVSVLDEATDSVAMMKSYDQSVLVADEATSAVTKTLTVSCHSLNYVSSISFRQFNQITSVLSTLLSLHRTLHFIITYLLF